MKKIFTLLTAIMFGLASFTQVNASTLKSVYQQHLKKDGTPDKRYKENKHLKKDGTPDKRFKANKTTPKKTKAPKK